MKKHVSKVVHTYRNQGPQILVKKSLRYGSIKMRNILGSKQTDKIMSSELWEEYAFVTNKIFQIKETDILESKKALLGSTPQINTANWLVPNFDHLSFGGIFTIFRFIEKFSKEGVRNRIIIYDNPSFNVAKLTSQIEEKFPDLKDYEIIIFDHGQQDINELPECDVTICSFWVSAYLLLKFNKTKRKYYFVQDYEPLFYPGGSTYALAESTYRFGFRGLVNTPGLLAAVNQRHGMEGISFVPAVDKSIYYPDLTKTNKRTKIFFYARPNNPRNAFNLGITIIQKLVEEWGEKIEILTAGAEWDESLYGLKGKITNLGLLQSIEEVAALYRSCDIGFVYMLSKHPSYQPFEFMASGMATVTNNNEDNLWFLKDGYNCLLSEPSPTAMAEKITQLIESKELRDTMGKNGLNTLDNTWADQLEVVWNDISKH
jgi:O-antigen biosynthesis protein